MTRLRTLILLHAVACAGGPKPDTPVDEDTDLVVDTDVDASSFAVPSPLDPHAVTAAAVLGTVDAALAWPGEQLADEPYAGALRSPAAVLSARLGNELDRCTFTRHLLGAAGVPSRLALEGPSCAVEARVEGSVVAVPTGIEATTPTADWVRALSLPEAQQHVVELAEVRDGVEVPLLTVPLDRLGPIRLDYLADPIRLQLRTDDSTVQGAALDGVGRHALRIRHVAPDEAPVAHDRLLFDDASVRGNQSPDPGVDRYGLWVGAFVPSVDFVDREGERLTGDDADLTDVLAHRAQQLAFQTDEAAWQLFEDGDAEGVFTARALRVVVAAREQRGEAGITPSFDLLANPRLLTTPAQATEMALGWSDALTEAAYLRALVDAPVLGVSTLFSALVAEEPMGEAARIEAMAAALERLHAEGETGDGLTFVDPATEAAVTVWLSAVDLWIAVDPPLRAALEGVADQLPGLLLTNEGAVVEPDTTGAGVVQLLLLESGAALDHRVHIRHLSGIEGALVTPAGTTVSGSGDHAGTPMTFQAVARWFETLESASNEDHDAADWVVRSASGARLSGGDTFFETPSASVDGRDSRFVAFGTGPTTTSFYESPLWLAPTVAAQLRLRELTELRFSYATGTASDWTEADLSVFTEAEHTLVIDGEGVTLPVLTAQDAGGQFSVTIARSGLSRLVLASHTPASEAAVERLLTPRALRLRARAVSERGAGDDVYRVPLPDAELVDGIAFAAAWPDGSLDATVPGSERPTLDGSVALLIDTSCSMLEPADPGCTGQCDSRLDVVADALTPIVDTTSTEVELALWTLKDDASGECATQIQQRAEWTLSREAVLDANLYTTLGTPLTGAVSRAVDEMSGGLGADRRLIVLSDGANTCADGLDTVTVPANLVIHTIGVGLSPGGPEELELEALALRTRGTYTRTTDAASLSADLTAVATAPPLTPLPTVAEVEARATGHAPLEVGVPVDTDGVEVVLEPLPDHPLPALVAWMPGEPMPAAEIDSDALALLEAQRAAHPDSAFILPDRPVSLGAWPDAFGWLEVNLTTGATTALTYDGLHGASGIPNLGATVAGLWTGVDIVVGNFDGCVLAPEGCGTDLATIEAAVCTTEGLEGVLLAQVMRLLGGVFPTSAGDLEDRFAEGIAKVEARCRGEYGLQQLANDACGDLGGPDDCGDLIASLWQFYAGFL